MAETEQTETLTATPWQALDTDIRTVSALAWRLPIEEVRRQHDQIVDADGVRALLDRLPHAVLLVNRHRQIVYANPAASPLFGDKSVDAVIGLRPGEAVDCRHSDETADGCGTTEFCGTCGVARTLAAGQRGERASAECRIISKTLGHDKDLRVWAAPLTVAGEPLTLFSILDISDEKRREMLERVFFHDVLNTAGGILGMATLCANAALDERGEMSGVVARLAGTLIEELKTQQSLAATERGDLLVWPEPLSSLAVLQSLIDTYRTHPITGDRQICLGPESADVMFVSDATLLRRVLGNMTRNALEGCPAGGTITLSCSSDGSRVLFRVHNPMAMPRDVQLQLFQRSFSTKGPGRGMGTYSMKLLSERYLCGQVSFISSEEHGTTFVASYRRAGPSVSVPTT